MKNKFTILILILSIFSCKKEKPNPLVSNIATTVKIEEADYTEEIKHIKTFAKKGDYNNDIAILIDYSIHSGKKKVVCY